MLRMTLDTLGSDLPLPPLDASQAKTGLEGGGNCYGVLYTPATSQRLGAVVVQEWQVAGKPHCEAEDRRLYRITADANKLADAGLRGMFRSLGVYTRVAEVPPHEDQPASTLAVITLPPVASFCEGVNETLQNVTAGRGARLIAGSLESPKTSHKKRLIHFRDRALRISPAAEENFWFGFHDQVVHGLAWLTMGLVPEIPDDIGEQAAALLDSAVGQETTPAMQNLSTRADTAVDVGYVAGVLTRPEPPYWWGELFKGTLQADRAAELIKARAADLATIQF